MNKISKPKEPLAEVIESFLDSYLAQCWQWDDVPDFGSLVFTRRDKNTIFGIVIQIQTGSSDPIHYPFPYKKTEEELMAEQPQIFEFLKTTFMVQIVGYLEEDKHQTLSYQLPTKPCKIHSFVSKTSQEIATQFFSKPDYLYLLFNFEKKIPNLDELLLAIIKQLSKQKALDSKKINELCEVYSLLTRNDYRRLKMFLKRLELNF